MRVDIERGCPRDNPNERRSHNRRVAETLARAGIYVFPSSGKVPLVLEWQRADSAIGTDGAEDARASARKRASDAGRKFDDETFVGATIDLQVVKRMWRKHPDAVPSISLGPSNLYVLDADIDSSRNGPDLLRAYLNEQGVDISNCPVTVSRSGGLHVYFRCEDLRSHIGPTLSAMYVQAKARGGQVVAPNAWREDGKRYSALPGQPALASAYALGDLPAPHPVLIKLQTERSEAPNTDDVATMALAERLRSADLPEALNAKTFIHGDKANDRSAYRLSLANRMCRAGLSAEDYLAALLECEHAGTFVHEAAPGEGEFNLRNVARDWSQAEARHAEETAKAESINAASASIFGDCTDTLQAATAAIAAAIERGEDPGAEIDRLKLAEASADDATAKSSAAALKLIDDYALGLDLKAPLAALQATMPANESAPIAKATGRGYKAETGLFENIELTAWTIDGILPEHGVGFLVGSSHTGKTFACIDMMGHLAQGASWFGREVYEPTCALYVGGEDVEEIPGRVRAWTLVNGSTKDRLGVMDVPPNLASDPKAMKSIVGVVKNLKADTGLRCGLIVLDTVASLAVGLQENDATDVGKLIDLMRKIARATGAAVLGVHHPRKGSDGSEGRGSGAFYNNATFEFRLVKKKGARRGLFQVHKNKFAALEVGGLPFQLDPVEIGTNKHGKVVTTLVFKPADATAFPAVEIEEEQDDDGVTPSVDQAPRGQDRVLEGAKRAIERTGGPVKRAEIGAEVDEDGGRPMSGNSLGPLIARLVDDGALVRDGRQRYGLP